jgi:hypothetical protein
MILSELIPNNSDNWSFDDNFIYWKKYQKIPICFIDNDIVYVFLDNRLPKPVIKLVSFLTDKKLKFYFTIPELSNPSGVFEEDYHQLVIRQYLFSYSQKEFFYGFEKINFDLIKNLTDWTIENNCFNKIKPIFDSIKKTVLRKNYDWYSKKENFDYDLKIREDFQSLYRQIQINQII